MQNLDLHVVWKVSSVGTEKEAVVKVVIKIAVNKARCLGRR